MSRIFESMTMLGMLGGSGGGSGGNGQDCLSLQIREAAMPERELHPFWMATAFGGDKFVAVSQGNSVPAYSTDGIAWQDGVISESLASNVAWFSTAYGNGKFVAVAGSTDKAIYSEDGITWVETTMPRSAAWYSVAYGNGRFVAVTYGGGYAAYSNDGITWTEVEMPGSNAYWWSCVTFGNGKFVAVTDQANVAAYSEDGITWTEAAMPEGEGDWYAVVFGGGRFAAVGIDNNRAAYSEDGITWTETTMPAESKWRSVTYGSGKFVAVAEGTDKAAYSIDGIAWKESTMPFSADWYSAAYGEDRFVAVASDSDTPAISKDGITWVTEVDAIMQGGQDVTQQVSQAQGAQEAQGVILSGPAQPGQLLLVESVSEDGKLLKCTAVDRTHGVMVTTYTENTIFDGNIEGRETLQPSEGMYFVKVSNRILSIDDLVGSTLVMVQDGEKQEVVLTSDEVVDAYGDGIPAVMYQEYVISAYEDASRSGLSITKGTWFLCAPGVAWVESVSCLPSGEVTGETLKKLDNKFLDLDWIPTKTTGERKEMLAETTVSSSPEAISFEISNLSLGDKVFVTINGATYTCMVNKVEGVNTVGNLSLLGAGANTGEPFIIVPKADNDLMAYIYSDLRDYTLSITVEQYTYSKIPAGYLPYGNTYVMPTDLQESVVMSEVWEAAKILRNGGIVLASKNGQSGRVLFAMADSDFVWLWFVDRYGMYRYNTMSDPGWQTVELTQVTT